jgi:1-acyl-sn-glycerol-3-phosphate acyltransferase
MKKISRWLLKITGWKYIITVPEPPKSILCVAPHTSNWDFILGKLYSWADGLKSGFLIKSTWFFFPVGSILRAMGGIPVYRSRKKSVTQQVVALFNSHDSFHVAVTPEGTRKLAKKWKMGFYQIALQAQVPIQLAYIDYAKKEIGIKKLFVPTGDEKADLQEIYKYFEGVTARYPKQFYLPT